MYRGLWKLTERYLEEGSVVSVYLAVLIICWTAAGVITGLILCSVLGVDIGNALSDIACMGAYAGILFGLCGGLVFLCINHKLFE